MKISLKMDVVKIIKWAQKIYRVIKNPYILISKLIKGRFKFIGDKTYLSILYRASLNEKIDFQNPLTYNQKLQYLKLNDRESFYKKMVDKYEVRKVIEKIIGKEHLVKCYGVWNKVEDINFNILPDKFVIKCTHDSGSVIIVRNKNDIDLKKVKKKVNKWLKKDYFWVSREWPYKNIRPRVIIEELLEAEENDQIRDYKFFCFSGVPKYLYIASDRNKGEKHVKFDYFDIDFNRLDLVQTSHPNSKVSPKKPKCYNQMTSIASKLSKGIPHVRIDLYEVKGKVYFGEFTFYHHGGFVPFEPPTYDRLWGEQIDINNI